MSLRLTKTIARAWLLMFGAGLCSACAAQYGCDANQNGVQTCTDYQDSANTLALASAHCSGLRGSLRTDACPRANRVGTCTVSGMAGLGRTVNFYRPITPLAGTAACAMVFGTFVETP